MPDAISAPSTRRLIWRRFQRSRSGMAGFAILCALYGGAVFAGLLAPFDPRHDDIERRYVPPQRIHLFADDGLHAPFVYGLTTTRDDETLSLVYTEDRSVRHPVHFFRGGRLVSCDGPLHLLGTDKAGRDVFSRILHGGRISLSIGLVGVLFALVLGASMGTVSAYYGGVIDLVMQRLVELLSSFPSIPLWMALAAALPPAWPPLRVYLAITIILSLLGWGGLARQVRGKLLSVRDADYVLAARAAGAGDAYLLRRHLLPAATSHLLVAATLAVPGMILGETALSFLGLGVRPPLVSWGVLLEESQRVTVVLHHPWLLFPAVAVTLAIVAFNLVGDALRDAADPWM